MYFRAGKSLSVFTWNGKSLHRKCDTYLCNLGLVNPYQCSLGMASVCAEGVILTYVL